MRIVRKGKEYDYDYKTVFLQAKQHKLLQDLAIKNKLSIGKTIVKLIKHYENTKTEEK